MSFPAKMIELFTIIGLIWLVVYSIYNNTYTVLFWVLVFFGISSLFTISILIYDEYSQKRNKSTDDKK